MGENTACTLGSAVCVHRYQGFHTFCQTQALAPVRSATSEASAGPSAVPPLWAVCTAGRMALRPS